MLFCKNNKVGSSFLRYIVYKSNPDVPAGVSNSLEKPKTAQELLNECKDVKQQAYTRLKTIYDYCVQKQYSDINQWPLDLRADYRNVLTITEKLNSIVAIQEGNLVKNPDTVDTKSIEETLKALKIAVGYAPRENNPTGPVKFEHASEKNFTIARYAYGADGKPINEVVDTGPGFIENKRGELEKRFTLDVEGVVVHINIPKIDPSKPIEFQPYMNADGNNIDRTSGSILGAPPTKPNRNPRWHDQEIGSQTAMMRDLGKSNLVYAIIRPTEADNWKKLQNNPQAMESMYAKIEKQFQSLYPGRKFDTITLSGHSGGGRPTNSDVREGLLKDPRINKFMGFDMYIRSTAPQYIKWVFDNPKAIFCHVGGDTVNQQTNELMMFMMDKELEKRGLPKGEKIYNLGMVTYKALGGRFQLLNVQRGKGAGNGQHTQTVIQAYRYASAIGDKKLEAHPECEFFISEKPAYGTRDKNNHWSKLKPYAL